MSTSRSNRPVLVEATVGEKGRVVVPSEIRDALGLQVGDRLTWVMDDAGVHVLSARALAAALWARNTGGDGREDSTEDLRTSRAKDVAASDAKWHRIAEDAAADDDPRSDEEIASDLLAAAGLL